MVDKFFEEYIKTNKRDIISKSLAKIYILELIIIIATIISNLIFITLKFISVNVLLINIIICLVMVLITFFNYYSQIKEITYIERKKHIIHLLKKYKFYNVKSINRIISICNNNYQKNLDTKKDDYTNIIIFLTSIITFVNINNTIIRIILLSIIVIYLIAKYTIKAFNYILKETKQNVDNYTSYDNLSTYLNKILLEEFDKKDNIFKRILNLFI